MTSFLRGLYDFFLDGDEALSHLPAILDHQAAEQSLGGVRFSNEWLQQRSRLDALLEDKTDESLSRALKIFAKVIDTLDLYAPALKGLTDVHAYACETLESVIFDRQVADRRGQAAAFLYGQAMAMSSLTAEAVALATENLLLRGDQTAANLALCIILGVERSSPIQFESNLPVLLRQVQMAAFGSVDKSVPQEALIRALKIYVPSEKAASCQLILQSTHALLAASLQLCEEGNKAEEGVIWTCFVIEHMPMLLRNDLHARYARTCNPLRIFALLLPLSGRCSSIAQNALCAALPILATWDTSVFCSSTYLNDSVKFLLSLTENEEDGDGDDRDKVDGNIAIDFDMDGVAWNEGNVNGGKRTAALYGLGQMAAVTLDKFEPFLDDVGMRALKVLEETNCLKEQKAAQRLLFRLLSSLGPITLDVILHYLHCPHHILLADVGLLEMIATLLPNLAPGIVGRLVDVIDDLLSENDCSYPTEAVLEALNIFPLSNKDLAARAQRLVIWALEEDKGKHIVIAALQLSTNPIIATQAIMRNLTFKAAQLLLADDAHIVHVALSVLSNPLLASSLDERSCSMILLALHQSLEPSIQIVAAKLLTHLTTAHRAIVQPLAWSHIRQSLSLMDFLQGVDPTRAIVEACIISNLLPALPNSLHKKYVIPVKELIMAGLRRPCEPSTLSLIFQGLSNLAKFEGYGPLQQAQLAMDLLEMSAEIPKDCQHAALNAISALLSVPQDGLDVYELLIGVHATFGGGRGGKLDNDLKALVSGIYGHLGTVERNPVISRDSKAAINRETTLYSSRTIHQSRTSEIRDSYGALSSTSINRLLSETLQEALTSSHKATDDRALVLEIMTCLGILQPKQIPTLINDLPSSIIKELRYSLTLNQKRDSTSLSSALLFLSSAIHTSENWLQNYWLDTAEIMAECIGSGEALPVLRGLDVVLDAVPE